MHKRVYFFINYIRSENGYAIRIKAISNILIEFGLDVKIIPLCYITPNETIKWVKQKFSKKRDIFGLSSSYLVPVPTNNFIIQFLVKLFFQRKLNKYNKDYAIIYWAETYFPAHYALSLKNENGAKVVVDIHGAQGEELSEYSVIPNDKNVIKRVKLLNRIEHEILKNDSSILTVSSQMVKHLTQKTGYVPTSNILIPCFPDLKKFYPVQNASEKTELRNKLNIPVNNLTLIYVGSLDQWQCITETIVIFEQISKIRTSTLVMLTPNSIKACEIVKTVLKNEPPHDNVICKTVPHSEVRDYIAASDIGFLLRKSSTTNIVSSPTKFAEYLACGIPVIATEFAGISGNIIESDRVGLVINLDSVNVTELSEFIDDVTKNNSEWVKRCRTSAEVNFDQSIYKERIKELLKL